LKPAFKGDSSLLCPIWENLSSGYGIMIRLCRSIVHTKSSLWSWKEWKIWEEG